MTFEHYPFDPCNLDWSNLYDEPQLVRGIMETWRRDGLPRNVPMEITESNLAFDTATEYATLCRLVARRFCGLVPQRRGTGFVLLTVGTAADV